MSESREQSPPRYYLSINQTEGKAMKNRVLKYLATLLALGVSGAAHSAYVTLTDYTLWSTTLGSDVIRITASTRINPANCLDPDSYLVPTTLSKEAKARIYTTLLTARALGKPVEVWVSDTICESSRPAIDTVKFN
jgi:hypothetical protein